MQYQAQKLGLIGDNLEDVEFTPEIGEAIIKQLRDSAMDLEVRKSSESISVKEKNDSDLNDESLPIETMGLIPQLREAHRRTLLACAGGLQEYLDNL